MRRILIPIVLSVLSFQFLALADTNAPDLVDTTAPAPVVIDKEYHVGIYAYVSHFAWEEEFEGIKIVDEDGTFVGIGLEFDDLLAPHALLLGRGDFFLGQADYAGGIQNEDGSITPYNSDTSYGGVRGQLALGAPIALTPSLRAIPVAGFGGTGPIVAAARAVEVDQVRDSLAHLGGGLVGEGHAQDRLGGRAAIDEVQIGRAHV